MRTAALYCLWILAYKLITLTVITFLLGDQTRLQEIGEAYNSNEVLLQSLGALLFVWVLELFNPATRLSRADLLSWRGLKTRFAPGFARGAVLAIGICAAFKITGLYQNLGLFIQADETGLALVSILIKTAALLVLVYSEELVFRQKIIGRLHKQLPLGIAILVCAAFYTIAKGLQFELGLRQLSTLFLISVSLGLRASLSGDFIRGAGYFAGILILFHSVLSLPIFGDAGFHGVWMMTYLPSSEVDPTLAKTVSGGYGGPLSSLALQLLFLFDIVRSVLKNKELLFFK